MVQPTDPSELAGLAERIDRVFSEPDWHDDEANCEAVRRTMHLLDAGLVRVASPPEGDGDWIVNAWVKRAVLMNFRIAPMGTMDAGIFRWFDKIPIKRDYEAAGVRAVPPATVRFGAFVERGAILMPCYVNVGAWVGGGTMVDTWATVGSCAQIGRGVHLSGGVGIGGVLEPPGAAPVIIEDGAFVGSRAIVVEGVRVEREAVVAANVVLTASTPIIDVTGPQEVIHRGRVPARSVVIPGTRPKVFPAGTYQVACALIIGRRKESTNRKTSLNEVLREFAVQV
jgi:2,3,4,5-tetrahydropyridine-2-carboxylate N-succinyltransferase